MVFADRILGSRCKEIFLTVRGWLQAFLFTGRGGGFSSHSGCQAKTTRTKIFAGWTEFYPLSEDTESYTHTLKVKVGEFVTAIDRN